MNNIRGWFTKNEQLEIIRLVHKYNHADCVGVEVGCLHGRSSHVISKAIYKGKLYCIDLWDGKEAAHTDFTIEQIDNLNLPIPGTKNTLELFLENTKDRDNIIAIQGSSPSVVADYWTQPIDFIFLDALHRNPSDRDNIDFWLPKIKSGGMFIGHDLHKNRTFPDVNLNVEFMENLLNQKVNLLPNSKIWYFNI